MLGCMLWKEESTDRQEEDKGGRLNSLGRFIFDVLGTDEFEGKRGQELLWMWVTENRWV